MKHIVWISLASMTVLALSAAEPDAQGVVKAAAKKLADQPSYSWTSLSKPEGDEQGFRMTAEGKTEKGGYTQLALTFGDRTTDVAMKAGKVATKLEGEWKSTDELEGRAANMARRLQNYKLPAAEAEEFADKATELKAGADGLSSGRLPESVVKEMFARFGRGGGQAPQVKDAKGSVKFWVKAGALTKYEFNVQGTLTVGQDNREMNINRTTTVDLKDVGTTKVSLPEEAKKKLS